jgi:hypothetical protein
MLHIAALIKESSEDDIYDPRCKVDVHCGVPANNLNPSIVKIHPFITNLSPHP